MADFKKAYELMLGFEFNNPKNALHKNPTEKGLTFMGIYEIAHPSWAGWLIVKDMLRKLSDIKEASAMLYQDKRLKELVAKFYKTNFWDKIRGDEITSQHIADEIFIFGVNVGAKQAIKTAQRVLKQLEGAATDGLAIDGIVGAQTLAAINRCDVNKFDKAYDSAEIAYYNTIIQARPSLRIYAKGWRNRAERVQMNIAEKLKHYTLVYSKILADSMAEDTPYDRLIKKLDETFNKYGIGDEKSLNAKLTALTAMVQGATATSQEI